MDTWIDQDKSMSETRDEFYDDLEKIVDVSETEGLDPSIRHELRDIVSKLYAYKIVFIYAEYMSEMMENIPKKVRNMIDKFFVKKPHIDIKTYYKNRFRPE